MFLETLLVVLLIGFPTFFFKLEMTKIRIISLCEFALIKPGLQTIHEGVENGVSQFPTSCRNSKEHS